MDEPGSLKHRPWKVASFISKQSYDVRVWRKEGIVWPLNDVGKLLEYVSVPDMKITINTSHALQIRFVVHI